MSEPTRKQIIEERRRLRTQYGKLLDAVAKVLHSNDPISMGDGIPSDEYEPEAGTILPRLRGCRSEDDVLDVVHSEFAKWFDPATAGPREGYRPVAAEIWKIWHETHR